VSNLFEFITYPMELGLIWLAIAVGSAGVGIILFTIFVRLVLSPLQITQLRSAKNMQRIQPLIAELRKKHGKDRQKLTEETMKLYKEHRVNPAMGCLPTLLQFPILIGLFYALFHLGNSKPIKYPHACNGFVTHNVHQWMQHCYAIKGAAGSPNTYYDLFHAHFMWLSNGLGQPDPLLILPILAGVTQWVQSRMMLTKSTDPQQQMMNTMMNFMPLMIVFFATRYASGLSLYWVTSTLIGIAIQYRITGWGLLPETLRNMGRVFGMPRGAAAGRQRTQSRPQAAAGKQGSTSKNGRGTKPVPAASLEETAPIDMNGNDGSDGTGAEQPSKTTAAPAVRPRKRPNRGRGGRGGRRG
jgi:YidC/Oxa1 family membrane protein insertase